jgi:indolepyruvate ferredoxin oxidoreductase alpha subunit
MVEKAFELSEATNTPVMMELRIRACHVTGEFVARTTWRRPSRATTRSPSGGFNYDRISHPPSTYAHEKIKVEVRQPAARALHRRARPERVLARRRALRPRHHRAGRHHKRH